MTPIIKLYIFTPEDLKKAIKSTNDHLEALDKCNFEPAEKIALRQTYIRLRRIYKKRLRTLNLANRLTASAKNISVSNPIHVN